jgi:hypothetical chaperone protein
MDAACIGIDFGTTNSAMARADASGATEIARFNHAGGLVDVYRSILYFEHHKLAGSARTLSWTGPSAVDHYLAAETKGRLIQSLKSFLSSRTLEATDVFGRRHTIQDLIARILRDLREQTETKFQTSIRAAVVGRPVRFVGAANDDDNAFAERRLLEALHLAGFERVRFELEPVAAAHFYQSTLDHDELILIGDFGGGTSDFSLIRVGPSFRAGQRNASHLLGNAGVGLAGDAFDARIVRHLVSPALGAGTEMRSLGKMLPVPIAVYSKLERWHYLSLLRNNQVLAQLDRVRANAEEPQKILALIHLIKSDLGYQLHRAVQALKYQLSHRDKARFQFRDDHIDLDIAVERPQFEWWIREELEQIETCVDGLLAAAGVRPSDIEMVFLTGGTSFVPAVRRIFESRFSAERLRTGNEFTSVARGLSLKALELSGTSRWTTA